MWVRRLERMSTPATVRWPQPALAARWCSWLWSSCAWPPFPSNYLGRTRYLTRYLMSRTIATLATPVGRIIGRQGRRNGVACTQAWLVIPISSSHLPVRAQQRSLHSHRRSRLCESSRRAVQLGQFLQQLRPPLNRRFQPQLCSLELRHLCNRSAHCRPHSEACSPFHLQQQHPHWPCHCRLQEPVLAAQQEPRGDSIVWMALTTWSEGGVRTRRRGAVNMVARAARLT